MPTSMAETDQLWQALRADLEMRNQRLLEGLEAPWQDLVRLLGQLETDFPRTEEFHWRAGKLESLRTLFGEAAPRFWLGPMARCERLRTQDRALEAVEDHRAGLEDLLRQLPGSISAHGVEMVETVGAAAGSAWRSYPLRWRKRPRTFHLRHASRDFLHRWMLSLAKPQGELLLVMAQTCIAVIDPWQALRDEALRCLDGSGSDIQEFDDDRQRWLKLKKRLEQRAQRSLAQLRTRVEASTAGLASAWLGAANRPEPSGAARQDPLVDYAAYWSRQRTAVVAQQEIERQLIVLGGLCVDETERTLESLDKEYKELFEELEAFGGWLESWQPGNEGSPPPPGTQLITAEDRARDWGAAISHRANEILPAAVETTEPRRALPGWRQRWGQLQLTASFLSALRRVSSLEYLTGLAEAEGIHRRIVREIERGREVVTYGLEVGRAEGASGEQMERESVENAKSLVLFQKKKTRPVGRLAETSLAEALAAAFSQCYGAVEEGRFGLLSRLARQRGRRTWAFLAKRATVFARDSVRWVWGEASQGWLWLLIQIGLEREPEKRVQHVNRRAVLEVDRRSAAEQQLPMIYRRLFRLEPVQDPRFLVGREAEMEALLEARQRWEARKPVSVVLVGERGSGKTSLLNCAGVRVFGGTEWVRASFRERVLDPEQVDSFLRATLGLPDEADLLEALRSERRVILLEEVERSFLRCVDGFHGVRRLLSLISDSCRSTLWVLCLNQLAFKFLHPAIGMGQTFSHRINAMSVEPESLQRAILLRHNLSGLRLRFARPPSRFPVLDRLRRPLGLDRHGREVFFDVLYQQSEGVFRSAFELWHRYIDQAQGGVLRMRAPEPVDNDPLITGLDPQDLFMLQAVLQHGSLTAGESARVFSIAETAARGRLESLIDRGILEPEPNAPGWRVRSEAGYLVRKALDRQNLL